MKVNQSMPNNTAVIYARFSSNNQRDESIDAQVRACKEYALAKGLAVIKIYSDYAKSATTDDREEFQQMVKDSKNGEFYNIIVHKLDRFSRDKYDSVTYKRKLKLNGVTLLSVTENLDGSPASHMLESVLEGMAQYYSANLAREVMKGLKETAYKCKHTGGFAPLGYDVDPITKKYIINENEAPTIRKIFEMYTSGHGYKQLMQYLNSMGYKTKTGKEFGSNSLHIILRNQKYCGTYVYNKKLEKGVDGKRRPSLKPEDEVIRIENGMPAIIDKETFEKAQYILAKNSTNGGKFKAKEIYILSGIAYCGDCGSTLYGNSRLCGRGKTRYVTYRCSNRAQHKGCTNKELRREYLENYVLDELYTKLFNEATINKLAKMLTKYNREVEDKNKTELTTAEQQLKATLQEIEKVIDLVSQSGIAIDTVKGRLQELESKKNYLEGYIKELTTNEILQTTEAMIHTLIQRSKEFIRTKNVAECRMFITSYIDKVLVFSEHVKVYFKISIPTDDMESLVPLQSNERISVLQRDYKKVI